VTSKGDSPLGVMCVSGNSYAGHYLQQHIHQIDRLYSKEQIEQTLHVDMGSCWHDCAADRTAVVDKRRRGETTKLISQQIKRLAVVKPTIGHLKSENRCECNALRCNLNDSINALLGVAAKNFGKLLGFLLPTLLALLDPLEPRHSRPRAA
jgi:hypothetical protein